MNSELSQEIQEVSHVEGTTWRLTSEGLQPVWPYIVEGWPTILYIPDGEVPHKESHNYTRHADAIVVKLFDGRKGFRGQQIGDGRFDLPVLGAVWSEFASIVVIGCSSGRMRRLLASIDAVKRPSARVIVIGAGRPWSPVPVGGMPE